MTDIQTPFNHAHELLTQMQTSSLQGLEAIIQRRQLFEAFDRDLEGVEHAIAHVRGSYRRLPSLPDPSVVLWAQATLSLPHFYVEVDTNGLDDRAEITRFLLLGADGLVAFDSLVKPTQSVSAKIAHINGVSAEALESAPSLGEIWHQVSQLIQGKFLVSYGLEFDQKMLAQNATRLGLPPLPIAGDCLMEQSGRYISTSLYRKLSSASQMLGHTLPDHPDQTALDRAQAQRALHIAIAEGRTAGSQKASPEGSPSTAVDDFSIDDNDIFP